MPFQRFRDIADVPSPKRVEDLEERARRIQESWKNSELRGPLAIPRGVQRFRSIEDAAREREDRIRARMARLRDE